VKGANYEPPHYIIISKYWGLISEMFEEAPCVIFVGNVLFVYNN
jgi:hypothetical protein